MDKARFPVIACFPAILRRERRVVMASRIAWGYGLSCLLWGLLGSPLFGVNRAETSVWFLMPVLLYGIPLAGLLAGVVAWQGDAGEEGLLRPRINGALTRPLAKWLVWSGLLALASLALILPALPTAPSAVVLLELWAYAVGEIAVFTAFGLAIGRCFRDPALAHSLALMAGMLAIAGGGIIGYLAAWQPILQQHPDLWTLLLMAHPVEALRVSLLYSLEDLPFDARALPPLAAWWLQHPQLWFSILVLSWSALALALTGRGSAKAG